MSSEVAFGPRTTSLMTLLTTSQPTLLATLLVTLLATSLAASLTTLLTTPRAALPHSQALAGLAQSSEIITRPIKRLALINVLIFFLSSESTVFSSRQTGRQDSNFWLQRHQDYVAPFSALSFCPVIRIYWADVFE